MTPEQYLDSLLGLPGLANPVMSVDAKWVAWTWFRTGPAADVYVAPTDASAPPLRLTDTGDDTMLVSWTPDSRALIVAQDQDGDERVQLFRVDLERPGEMVPLTEAEPSFFLHGGQLHHSGRWLVYAANVDVDTGKEIESTWVYRHDLITGERVVLARPAKGHYYEPELNEQGTHILYSRADIHPAGQQVWLVDIEGQDDREILNVGPAAKVTASWFPDGYRVAVLAETGTYRRVGVWDRRDTSLRWLLDDPARNLEAAYVPHGSDRVIVLEVRQARDYVTLLDVQTGAEQQAPALPGTLHPLAPLPSGEWVGTYASSRQPADIVRFPLNALSQESLVSLTRVWDRTALRVDDLAAAEDFRWMSPDGREIQGWLYRPTSPPLGSVVYVHGGPTAHSEDRLNTQIQFFVRQGFVVLDPNYRGSTGFGLPFQDSIKEDGWGGREQDDILAGIQALLSGGIAAPGKVGITGTSYGGYSAWCAITRWAPDLLAAAAPICGMTDLVVDYQTTRPDLRSYSEEMMGGTPTAVPERYATRSPIHFVHNIRGCLLIIQGMQDPNVSPENVRAVEKALQAAGIPYDVLAFADEGHGISRPANQKTLNLRLAAFFSEAFATS